ncbi:hypothetical protein FACS1894164_04010 [Spirochaetia bacterium]|nr:hypothetical protein FACS1894164_04010 [Spirochaetia bacterium]
MLESSKVYENEIIKAEDVDFAFLQTIMNSAVVKGLLERTDVDMIVSGGQITQVAPMVLSVNRLFCIGQTLQVPIFLDQQSDDIQIPLADANQYRIDILEVIPEIQSFNHVQRAFYDPSLDAEQFTTVATKRRNRAVFVVKSGTPGLGTAPLTDDGYVKLAELIIPPLATELPPENILPVTAPVPGAANELWTSEPARTMFLGGIDTLKQQVIDSNTQTLEAANEYTDQRVAASENVDYIGKWPLESTLPHLADNPALRNGSTYGLENCDITAEGYSGLAKYESANDSWDIYPDMTLRMDQETITLRESDGAYQVNPELVEKIEIGSTGYQKPPTGIPVSDLASAVQAVLSYVDTGKSIQTIVDGIDADLDNKIDKHGTDRLLTQAEAAIIAGEPVDISGLQNQIDTINETLPLKANSTDVDQKITQAQLANQAWFSAVKTKADLPTPDNQNGTYLCRVIKDPTTPDPDLYPDLTSYNGVWQWIGSNTVKEWTYFSDNLDFIDETELSDAIAVETLRATDAELQLQAGKVASPESAVGETADRTLANGGTFKVVGIPVSGGEPIEVYLTLPTIYPYYI